MKKVCLLLTILFLLTGCGRWYQMLCWPSAETGRLLKDVMAGAGASDLKQMTGAPQRQEIHFSVAGKDYTADLYQPAEPALAGLVFLPGTTTDGKNDQRMIDFANSLARSRFNVIVPDLEHLKALKITPGDVDEIGDVFSYLAARQDLVPQGRAGIAAVSYIVGPAMLAAMQARIRERVKFIFSVGGYYDLERVLGYVTTGFFRDEDGKQVYRAPNAHGKWVLVLSNSDRLENAQDRETLKQIARIKIANPEAPIAELGDELVSREGQALIALMTNTDPARVHNLIAELPPSVRSDLDALNLSNKDLSTLKARVHLIHGYTDSLIPYTESLDLDRHLSSEHCLTLAHGLEHVEFTSEPSWFDAWSLACATNHLLEERSK